MTKITDAEMRRASRFYSKRVEAIQAAKERKGVAIQVLRGRQWLVASGPAIIKESMKRMRESTSYLGKPPPKIIADFRR